MKSNIAYLRFTVVVCSKSDETNFHQQHVWFNIDRDDINKFEYLFDRISQVNMMNEEPISSLKESLLNMISDIIELPVKDIVCLTYCDYGSRMRVEYNQYLKFDMFGNLQLFKSNLFETSCVYSLHTSAFIHIYHAKDVQKDRSENSEKGKESGRYYGKHFMRKIFTHVIVAEKMQIDMDINDLKSIKKRIDNLLKEKTITDIILFIETDEREAIDISSFLKSYLFQKYSIIIRTAFVQGDTFVENYGDASLVVYQYLPQSYNKEIKLPKVFFNDERFK